MVTPQVPEKQLDENKVKQVRSIAAQLEPTIALKQLAASPCVFRRAAQAAALSLAQANAFGAPPLAAQLCCAQAPDRRPHPLPPHTPTGNGGPGSVPESRQRGAAAKVRRVSDRCFAAFRSCQAGLLLLNHHSLLSCLGS
jgi:hypothetical protein